MSTPLHKHLLSGEVSYSDDSGYYCNICELSLEAQPLQHLNGTQHKNKVFFSAVQLRDKYPILYDDLDLSVREAIEEGIIEVQDLKIRCHCCAMALSGEKPLMDHLKSSGHRKKNEMKKISRDLGNLSINSSVQEPVKEISPRSDDQKNAKSKQPKSTVDSTTTSKEAVHASKETKPDVKKAVKTSIDASQSDSVKPSIGNIGSVKEEIPSSDNAGQDVQLPSSFDGEVAAGRIVVMDGGVYRCTVCCMALTGREPVLQHISGKKHRSKVAAQSTVVSPAKPETKVESDTGPNTSETMESDLFGSSQHRSKHTRRTTREPEPIGSFTTPPQVQFPGVYGFNPVAGNFGVPGPYPNAYAQIPHLGPYAQMPLHPQNYPTPPMYGYPEQPWQNPIHSSSLDGSFPKLKTSEFRLKKSFGFSHRPPTAYRITSRPRGFVAVFNNHFRNNPDWIRNGSEMDDVNLDSVFKEMGYEVHLFSDTTKSQLMEKIDSILQRHVLGMDSLILFFLSHGKDERHFYSSQQEVIDIRDIWIKLTNQNCPALKDKPKIMFLNYCRGESRQRNQVFDNVTEREEDAPRDVALVHASLPGFKAQRMPDEGTIFVHCLCQAICENAYEMDIHEIINETSEMMKKKCATTPSIEFIDFKKFYFVD
ncbi:uncharacterized protein LOC108670568 [Hyalella azteca]|uniref:Uncharacterized protein LOC108670568 n=1 Tax=Hyalella azteca TaxID=294128 RepID=A0A8B7NIQ6_HYAAZ|nr:uncharacterized protein LOC108670568 [Hyalella azteca]